jgi:hypothetical protein
MGYATVDDVKAYLKGVDLSTLGTSTEQDDAITNAADGATAQVDHFTRRTFSTVTETRTFDGSGTCKLFIPDLISMTAWAVEGEAQTLSELTLYPLSGPPSLWLVWNEGIFPCGSANIEIAGTWGYANTVPVAIVSATAKLAAADVLGRLAPAKDLGARKTTQGSLIQEFETSAYAGEIERLTREAETLLKSFRRPALR